MPLAVAPGLLLLLLLASGTRGALVVSVPTSPVRAQPGSDLLLGCHFSVGGAVDMDALVVQWKLGGRPVAEFSEVQSYFRAGASLSLEGLRVGNASLLLPRVGGTDAGLYTCSIIHSPSRESRQVELRVEAPPRVSVSGTVVRAGEHSTVTCSVNSFYPESVNITWLRDKQIVGGPETPLAQPGPDGLYSATSLLQLVPSISHTDANYSCRVQHITLGAPIQEPFQLSVLSQPRLTLLQPLVTLEGQVTLQCLVSGYYPPDITVQWLRDGDPLVTMESSPMKETDGSFALRSSYILNHPESNAQANFACRVQHPALSTPLESTATWTVPQAPVLGEISRPQVLAPGERVTLSCQISRFYPKELSVTWHRRGRGEPAFRSLDNLHTHKIDTPDSTDRKSYSVTSQLCFTPMVPEDEGAEYRCYVEHVTLKEAEEKSTGPLELRGCPLLDGDMAIF
uniref:Ig-like domain-containing protein n=1 Tax=Gopherus agassizii TaxID=38772 RepID=A0A452GJ03_9SAUR